MAWSNWAGNVTDRATLRCPRTPEEVADDVVEILDEWAADPTSARAAGSAA